MRRNLFACAAAPCALMAFVCPAPGSVQSLENPRAAMGVSARVNPQTPGASDRAADHGGSLELRRRFGRSSVPPVGAMPVPGDTVAFSLLAFADDPLGGPTGAASLAMGTATLDGGSSMLTDQSMGFAPPLSASISQTNNGDGTLTILAQVFTGTSTLSAATGSFLPAGTTIGGFVVNTYAIDMGDFFHAVGNGLALGTDSLVEGVRFSFYDEGASIFDSTDPAFLNDLLDESVPGALPGTVSELLLQTGAGVPAGNDLAAFDIDGVEVAITIRPIPTPGAYALAGLAALFALRRRRDPLG